MGHELDADTALESEGEGRYRGVVTDRWGVLSGVPNGGFMMCYALRALADAAPKPDPLVMNAQFLRPGRVGPVTVTTELVKVGKRNATAMARVEQEGKEVLRALATFGRFDADARVLIDGAPPVLPPREACVGNEGPEAPAIAARFDNRIDPATVGWMRGQPSGEMVMRAWMRLADGRDPDWLAMPLFADGLPPPLFNAVTPGWVPTVELTVQFRAPARPGWLRAAFRTRFVSGGLLEEDGELWDEAGQLVALSRQLAVMPR